MSNVSFEQKTVQTKLRIFRPSLSQEEIQVLVRALRCRKLQLETTRDPSVKAELGKVTELWANLLSLIHGKVVGRRHRFSSLSHFSDEYLLHFKIIKEEWLNE